MSWLARLKKVELAGTPSHLEAPSSPASPTLDTLMNLRKPEIAPAANDPAPALPADPEAWRELAQAYYQHHFGCHVCIAAGRGTRYGLRCGAGAALWRAYDGSH